MEKNKENKIADEKLLSAVTQGNVSGLFRALEDGANIDCRVNSGQTPLIAAAESKNAEIASILLKNGADPNFSDVIYQTPLMRAVQGGAVDVAKLLINSGASVDKKDAEGYTVLLQLCAEPLEQKSEAIRTRFELAQILIDGGADVNTYDAGRRTPLMRAASSGNVKLVKLLLNKGADIHARDGHNRNALIWAAENEMITAVKLLSEKGADLGEILNPQGRHDFYFSEYMKKFVRELRDAPRRAKLESESLRKHNVDEIIDSLEDDLRK